MWLHAVSIISRNLSQVINRHIRLTKGYFGLALSGYIGSKLCDRDGPGCELVGANDNHMTGHGLPIAPTMLLYEEAGRGPECEQRDGCEGASASLRASCQ